VPLTERGRVVINKGSARWRAIRVEQPLQLWPRSRTAAQVDKLTRRRRFYRCSFQVLSDPSTSNSWRMCVGLVSSRFDYRARCWIGAQRGSFGYIAGTGGKCSDSGASAPYGAAWGGGDRVTLCVDLQLGVLQFSVNGVSQGVAFDDLHPVGRGGGGRC